MGGTGQSRALPKPSRWPVLPIPDGPVGDAGDVKVETVEVKKVKIDVKGSGPGRARSTQTKMPGILANLGHLLLLRDRFLRRSGSVT
jgi:hypothetical protein